MTTLSTLAAELRADVVNLRAEANLHDAQNYTMHGFECRARALGIEQAADRLDAMAREGWRPIAEAPRDGTVIWVGSRNSIRLAFWRNGAEYECRGTVGGGWRDNAKAESREIADLHFEPTHWQPLPPLPTGDA